jgi:FkbM family methyltransferase
MKLISPRLALRRLRAALLPSHGAARGEPEVEKLRAALARCRERAGEKKRRLRALKRQRPQASTLRQTLEHRLAALRASSRVAEAQVRHDEFKSRSETYRRSWECPAALDGSADEVEIGGIRWRVPKDARDPRSFSARVLCGWLPLREILQGRELAVGTAMIDIGANIGTTAIPRVVLGDFQFAYAFEPEPANYAALVQTIRANHLEGFVLPEQAAVGSCDGTARLRVARKMANHFLCANADSLSDQDGLIEVRCRTLDSWAAEVGVDLDLVSFIKCDAQGWEGHILHGSRDVLRQKHIAWQIEFWPSALTRSGYEPRQVVEVLRESFTHFIDLKFRSGSAHTRPTSDLEAALEYLDPAARARSAGVTTAYTNLLLYNAAGG